ncbi:uncharacterized protein LOC125672583 [Ostrea edulis]|uniref:uncharacterized protein LOC125672583 n=1 Tax=Ostrea edulis TaxID=37623 RepID=UPI0024AE9240|nr:uncharacterized protein LOC125672583 [Ostrea edulis]
MSCTSQDIKMFVRTQGWKEILMLLVVVYTYEGRKACPLCSFLNQTTDSSDCSEPCGGGNLYYFHYICCGNLTKSTCEATCNLTLSITKSLKVNVGCNRFCTNGGIFNETLETCLCSIGTSGKCCENNVTSSTASTTTPANENGSTVGEAHWLSSRSRRQKKQTLYVAVGVPISVILVTSAFILFVFLWWRKRKRRQQVDIIENDDSSTE